MKIKTLLSNYSYIKTISIDGGTDRCWASIGSAGLIAIKTYVTVDEEVIDPKLLDGIGTYRAIS